MALPYAGRVRLGVRALGELTSSAERRSLSLAFEPQKEESSWDFNHYRIGH